LRWNILKPSLFCSIAYKNAKVMNGKNQFSHVGFFPPMVRPISTRFFESCVSKKLFVVFVLFTRHTACKKMTTWVKAAAL